MTWGTGDVVASTPRLILRRWREEDLVPWAALNADPEVMEHLGGPMARADSDAFARYGDSWAEQGKLGLLPVVRRGNGESPADGEFVGMCGLHRHRWYPDEVEIGWRLARPAWGFGYATEAARCWFDHARCVIGLDHVISITSPENVRSQAVMARLGFVLRERAVHPALDGTATEVVVFTSAHER